MKKVLVVFIVFCACGFQAIAQSDSALAYRTPVKTFEESVEDHLNEIVNQTGDVSEGGGARAFLTVRGSERKNRPV